MKVNCGCRCGIGGEWARYSSKTRRCGGMTLKTCGTGHFGAVRSPSLKFGLACERLIGQMVLTRQDGSFDKTAAYLSVSGAIWFQAQRLSIRISFASMAR